MNAVGSAGAPISTMFLSPGVTPWKTTLPGVKDGANNPGIRIFEYDTQTLLVKVSQQKPISCFGWLRKKYRECTCSFFSF